MCVYSLVRVCGCHWFFEYKLTNARTYWHTQRRSCGRMGYFLARRTTCQRQIKHRINLPAFSKPHLEIKKWGNPSSFVSRVFHRFPSSRNSDWRLCVALRANHVRTRQKLTQRRYVSTGWRRLIGSPKLQIIFHKRATHYRSLLRKMTHKDKGFYKSPQPIRIYPRISPHRFTLGSDGLSCLVVGDITIVIVNVHLPQVSTKRQKSSTTTLYRAPICQSPCVCVSAMDWSVQGLGFWWCLRWMTSAAVDWLIVPWKGLPYLFKGAIE